MNFESSQEDGNSLNSNGMMIDFEKQQNQSKSENLIQQKVNYLNHYLNY